MICMKQIKMSELIAPKFYTVFNSVIHYRYMHYLLKGGRGSTKSNVIATCVIYMMLKNKHLCAAVFMKHSVRLRNGAFDLYRSVIKRMGLQRLFKISRSPMQITYVPTGQVIVFKGCDDPYKTKGIATSDNDMYFGILHFEELDQFSGISEVQTVIESIIRGGDDALIFYCYNPPANKFNWCNEWAHEDIPGRLVHHSTYLDIPVEWVGKAFIDNAEALKAIDEGEYENRYLGVETGTGGSVFDDIEERTITDEEIANFDCIFQGFDWGWMPDPAVFVRSHYDIKNNTIYIIDEIVGNKRTVESYANEIIHKGYNDYITTIDGAIPEQEYRFRQCGLNVMSVIKGPGSIDLGLNWMEHRKYVVDKNRTPFTYKELREYEYAKDRDGNFTGEYMDFNNHAIDAIRYSYLDSYIRRYPESY